MVITDDVLYGCVGRWSLPSCCVPRVNGDLPVQIRVHEGRLLTDYMNASGLCYRDPPVSSIFIFTDKGSSAISDNAALKGGGIE